MQTFIRYGRQGFERGDYRMALHYGLQAIGQVPWHPGGWGLLARALLKRPPRASADVNP
jgi:hypothetical protein